MNDDKRIELEIYDFSRPDLFEFTTSKRGCKIFIIKDCKELIRLLQKRIDMDNEKEGTNNE